MGSTFFGLNIGRTGLYAYQAALDTTAHNISNTETDGYTRQVMGQQADKALRVNSTYGMAGTGVVVTGVEQLRDVYYDIKYWKNNTMFGEYNVKSHYMTEIENYFNDIAIDGFTTTFNSMYNSIQELMKNPASLTVRTQVTNFAQNFVEFFNSTSQNLKSIQEECNFEVKNKVDQINSIAQQVAALTKQINTLEVNGGKANDLRDSRNLLIDELSEIANISVTEQIVGAAVGVTSYVVKLDGVTLVDGGECNLLKAVPRTEKLNQNDIDGLYDIYWSNGQAFNSRSASLGGALQALLEVRDGNNQFNLRGTVYAEAGDTSITLTDTNINAIEKLNIPETGILTVGNREYKYNGFEVTIDSDTGNFIYSFDVSDNPVVADAINEQARIGHSIDYKGIPYYMSQMNEYIRTFSKAFNEIHRTGVDLDGNAGMDFFTASHKISGRDYSFGPLKDSDDYDYYDFDTFNSGTGTFYEDTPANQPLYGSYYFMTAENFKVNTALIFDPKRLASATDVVNGSENNDVVIKLLELKEKKIFKNGAPDSFYQIMVAEIGIDTKKAANFSDSQANILGAIQNQRLSISGVDVDEEAMNLVRFQNAYNLSAKVISVMDEIYDKLINYMGV